MSSKEEKQRINILLAHGENPNYSHIKLAKLLNVAKSTVTNVLKTTKRVDSCFERNPNLSA